jgi:hypothetical protein
MEAKELVVGNWYKFETKIRGISDYEDIKLNEELMGRVFSDDILIALEDFHPIPLTEEWLERFGFEEVLEGTWVIPLSGVNTYLYYEPPNIFWLTYKSANKSWESTEFTDIFISSEIKHVHQLQNLYFTFNR